MENTNVPVISAKDLNLWYGDFKALKGISLDVGEREITALIGPSGCGKSTFLKTLNRMNDLVPNVRIEGDVRLKGEDIFCPGNAAYRPAPPGGHGVPEGQSLPHEHLRQYHLRPQAARRAQ